MTDIVQQLHDLYQSHPVVMQAADEIERLRQIKAEPPPLACCPWCGKEIEEPPS